MSTWGNNPASASSMLVGTYEQRSEIGAQLLSVLPRLAVMPVQEWDSPLLPILDQAGPSGGGRIVA